MRWEDTAPHCRVQARDGEARFFCLFCRPARTGQPDLAQLHNAPARHHRRRSPAGPHQTWAREAQTPPAPRTLPSSCWNEDAARLVSPSARGTSVGCTWTCSASFTGCGGLWISWVRRLTCSFSGTVIRRLPRPCSRLQAEPDVPTSDHTDTLRSSGAARTPSVSQRGVRPGRIQGLEKDRDQALPTAFTTTEPAATWVHITATCPGESRPVRPDHESARAGPLSCSSSSWSSPPVTGVHALARRGGAGDLNVTPPAGLQPQRRPSINTTSSGHRSAFSPLPGKTFRTPGRWPPVPQSQERECRHGRFSPRRASCPDRLCSRAGRAGAQPQEHRRGDSA